MGRMRSAALPSRCAPLRHAASTRVRSAPPLPGEPFTPPRPNQPRLCPRSAHRRTSCSSLPRPTRRLPPSRRRCRTPTQPTPTRRPSPCNSSCGCCPRRPRPRSARRACSCAPTAPRCVSASRSCTRTPALTSHAAAAISRCASSTRRCAAHAHPYPHTRTPAHLHTCTPAHPHTRAPAHAHAVGGACEWLSRSPVLWQVGYHLRVFSLEKPTLGSHLQTVTLPNCPFVTSVQFCPLTLAVLIGYGRCQVHGLWLALRHAPPPRSARRALTISAGCAGDGA